MRKSLLLLFFLGVVMFGYSQNAQIKVDMKGKVGVVDAAGNEVIPYKWASITAWGEHYRVFDGKKYGILDAKGNQLLPISYFVISDLNCFGKAFICSGGKIDAGKDGKAMIMGGKFGILNADGKILVEPKYTLLHEFTLNGNLIPAMYEGLALLPRVLAPSDTLLTDCRYVGYTAKKATAGLIDGETGQILIKEGEYSYIMQPKDGMARYYITNNSSTTCGYRDLATGQILNLGAFNTEFAKITFWTHGDFVGGIAPVNGATWRFIDKAGTTVREGYSKLLHSVIGKLWVVWLPDGKTEAFTEDNQPVSFLTGYKNVLTNIDPANKMQYIVQNDQDKYGALNEKGEIDIPFEYDLMLVPNMGCIGVNKGGKWGVISQSNEQLVPCEFADYALPKERNTTNLMVKKHDGKYYNFDIKSQTLATEGYLNVTSFVDGLAWVSTGEAVPNSYINKLLLNTTEDISATNAPTFGYIINTKNEIVFPCLIPTTHINQAMQSVMKKGSKLTKAEAERELLYYTRAQRHYDIEVKIEEDSWDF
jgi:hypothetical protein